MSSATQVPMAGPSTTPMQATRPTVSPVVLPTSSTFSFAAPYPVSASQPFKVPSTSLSTPTSPQSLKQQRRVSLALPGSPRPYTAWPFRDDTRLQVGNSASEASASVKGKTMDDGAIHLHGESASASLGLRPTSSFTTPNAVSPSILGMSTPLESPSPVKSGRPSTTSGMDPPKKPRKKWSMEETQMLVNGCNKWGVGNWKAILNDPELQFDNRSPVDLKDRFRTYFPDAYKHHYPNARTHLPSASASSVARASSSAKSRSLLPDGSPLFLSSRQKKRRPFTAEEDRALKDGYDKHGTVWATIVKDPIFKEQGRRSTDLRDRFRNAWPELYAKAGYKPRANAAKKKKFDQDSPEGQSPNDPQEPMVAPDGTVRPSSELGIASAMTAATALGNTERTRGQPVRAATDDQLPTSGTSSSIGPVRRKRRHTTQGFGLYRGGTKSVPESSVNTEDEASDDEEADWDGVVDDQGISARPHLLQSSASTGAKVSETADVEMDVSTLDLGSDFISSGSLSMSDMTDSSSQAHASWSELDTPLHSWASTVSGSQVPTQNQSQPAGASTSVAYTDSVAASPTSTDYFLPNSPNSRFSNGGMIGKSAWGPQDWLSPNPRLDGNGSSFADGIFTPSPIASPSLYSSAAPATNPVSFAQLSFSHLALASSSGSQSNPYSHGHSSHVHSQAYSHGVMDRYDLFPSTLHHNTSDDFDIDTLDLDFISEGFDAASSDVHSAFSDPSSAWTTGNVGPGRGGFTHHSNYAGDLIFGARTHQPTRHLSGMDYGLGFGFGTLGVGAGIGLGLEGTQAQSVLHTPALPGIDEIELTSISLNDPLPSEKDDVAMAIEQVNGSIPPPIHPSSPDLDSQEIFQPLSLDDIVGIPPGPDNPEECQDGVAVEENDTSHYVTPPATPANTFRASARAQGGFSSQHRSVSVPPKEHRAFMPPPRPGQSQMTSPKAKYKSLLMTPTRSTFAVPQLPPSNSHTVSSPLASPPPADLDQLSSHVHPTALLNPSSLWPPFDSENHGLPFLDLHYYTPNDYVSMSQAFPTEHIQLGAQALDLAQTLLPSHSQASASFQKQLCVPPSLLQPLLSTEVPHQGIRQPRSSSAHQRGHSAAVISPQDLLVRRGNDNKRKRASWDGGPK